MADAVVGGLELRAACLRQRVERLRYLRGAVCRQWRALQLFEAHLPPVAIGWGRSRARLLTLHTRRGPRLAAAPRLVLSRPLALEQQDGVFTLSTARLEDAVRHHAAHLLAGGTGVHDAVWRAVANRLGVLYDAPCGAVVN
jgi:hypothetical protein